MRTIRTVFARVRLGLAPQLIGLIVLVALASGGLVGIELLKTSRNALRDEIFRKNLSQADLAAEVTSNYIGAVQDSLLTFAAQPDLVQSVLSGTPDNVQAELAELTQTQPALDGVSLYDANGIQLFTGSANRQAVGTSFADREWFQGALASRRPYFGLPVLSRVSGHPIAPYAIPILDAQGRVHGVIAAGISLETLSDSILKTLSSSGLRTSLMDLRYGGLVLAHPDAARIMTPVTGQNEAALRLLAGERGALETPGSAGEPDLAVYAPVPDLPWGILIVQPSDTAFAPIDTMSNQAIFITALSILLAILVGMSLSFKITRPVIQLRDAARRLTAGKLGYPIGFTQRDEIGDLGRAFDEMAGVLSEKQAQLSTNAARLQQSVLDLQNEIAERQRAEQALRESERSQHSLFENMLDGFSYSKILFDGQGRPIDFVFLQVNPAFERLTGLAGVAGKKAGDLMPSMKSSYPQVFESCARVALTGQPEVYEFYLKPFDRWLSVSAYSYDKGYFAAVFSDITERKRAAEEQSERHGFLRILIDNLPATVYVKDTASRMLLANNAQARLLGAQNPEDLLGKTDLDFYPKEFALKFMADEQAIFASGQPLLDYEEVVVDTRGDRRWYLSTKVPFLDSQGKVKGIVGIGRDITERKRMEEELLKFRLGIERAADAIFMTDLDGTIVYVNPAFEKTYGYSREEALGQTPRILKSGQVSREAYEHFWSQLLGKSSVVGEIVNKTRDGHLVVMESSATPILDPTGEMVGFLGVQRDITRRKQGEEKLRREVEKLNALHDVDRALASTLDLNDCLDIIVNRVRSLFATSSVALMLREGDRLRMVAQAGVVSSEKEIVIPLTGSLTGWSYSHRASVFVPDVLADERYLLFDSRTRAEMAAPLLVQEECIGVLNVEGDQVGAFTPADLELLESLAGRAAVAIHNARLLKAENEQRQFSDTLRDFGLALTSQRDPDSVLDQLLDLVARVVPYDSASVVILEGERLSIKRQRGYERFSASGWVNNLEMPLEQLPNMRQMALTRRPVVVPDTRIDPNWLDAVEMRYIRSWVGAPIHVNGAVIGFLSLDKAEPRYYSQEMAERLAAFAVQAGLALDNARLYAEQQELAITDGLTGIFNRRHFMELAERECAYARRHASDLTVLMIDLDHFKQVNDRYGHAVGDLALQVAARGLASTVRAIDVVARYGGDEFVVLLPGCARAAAQHITDRLKQELKMWRVPTDEGAIGLSLSIGMAALNGDEDLDNLLARADADMYLVKAINKAKVMEHALVN